MSIEQEKFSFWKLDKARADLAERDEWWRRGIEDALTKNRATFALYPIERLLDESGSLAQRRDAADVIEVPM